MTSQAIEALVTIALGIIGVAVIAVLVSRNAQTTQVVGAVGQGFAQSLLCAVSPVSGGGLGVLGSGGACGTSVTSGVTFPTGL